MDRRLCPLVDIVELEPQRAARRRVHLVHKPSSAAPLLDDFETRFGLTVEQLVGDLAVRSLIRQLDGLGPESLDVDPLH